MPPASFPTPLPAWAKAAMKWADETLIEPYVSLLQYLENFGTSDQWRRLELRIKYNGTSPTVADDAYVTWDIANITGGQLDSTWTTGDYTTCEGLFTTWVNSMRPWLAPWRQVFQYRWYKRQFTPLGYTDPTTGKPKAFYDSGPPERITPVLIAGTCTTGMSTQQALSFTEITPWARHWGRFYWPGVDNALLATDGRIPSTNLASLMGNVKVLYEGLMAADFQPIVPVTQIDKVESRTFLEVNHVQIDDVVDVIRRRRLRNTVNRSITP